MTFQTKFPMHHVCMQMLVNIATVSSQSANAATTGVKHA
jgi:hypothetical protein